MLPIVRKPWIFYFPSGLRLDYQPLFEIGARAAPSEVPPREDRRPGSEKMVEIEPSRVLS